MKDAKHAKVLEVFRIIFTLSHGQAAVERGFSLNSELLVENLQEKTLVASRLCTVVSRMMLIVSVSFFYPQTETKCSSSKNAISVAFRRAKETSC